MRWRKRHSTQALGRSVLRFGGPRQARLCGLLMLTVLVLGGVVAPTLHHAHHGLEWSLQRAAGGACDHSTHGTNYEAGSAIFDVDLCAFCLQRTAPPPTLDTPHHTLTPHATDHPLHLNDRGVRILRYSPARAPPPPNAAPAQPIAA